MKNAMIQPKPPFNFDLICKITNNKFDGKEVYESGVDGRSYYLVLNLNGDIVPVTIHFNGVIEKPTLYVNFLKETSEDNVKRCLIVIEQMFDTNLDLKPFYKFAESDKILHEVANRLYGLRSPSTPTLFEAFIRAFIEQQLPVTVSNKIANRVIKNFGSFIEIKGVRYYAFPTAEQLANAEEEKLRKCGLSSRKVEYIKNFSNIVLNGEINLNEIPNWSEDRIIRELVKIRGIGRWTAEYVMIRGMHKYASTPADDLFLRRVISHYYFNCNEISGDEARGICERWGEWKGLASFYLIVDYLIHKER